MNKICLILMIITMIGNWYLVRVLSTLWSTLCTVSTHQIIRHSYVLWRRMNMEEEEMDAVLL